MIKTKKSTKTQLKMRTKTKKKVERKCSQENSNTFQASMKNKSDEEYYNFSDSSLELFDSFKPRTPKKSPTQKIDSGVIFDKIDLTSVYTESKLIQKKYSLSIITVDSSSSSDDSFKSTTSVLSSPNNTKKYSQDLSNSFNKKMYHKSIYKSVHNDVNFALNTVQNNFSELKNISNNYSTPKKKNISPKDLSESAKLLDRIYGKEWRNVDGVIKNIEKKSNENFANDTVSQDEIENSFTCEIPTNKFLPKNGVQIAVNDTSIIFENLNLSDNSDQVNSESSSQNNNYKCKDTKLNNVKQITKSKTSQKDDNLKKKIFKLNQLSKIPVLPNLEPKLSFLSSLSCFTGSIKCDPKAEKYKFKFKKNKDELVAILFKLFNEEVFENKLPANMNFKWNARLRSTAGACFNKRTVKINENLDCERVSRIELSSKIIDTAERLRDTLIHELCHAACWIFNGISEGHGPSWKSWANKAMQKYPELPIIKRCHSYDIQTKFTYKCIKCGYSLGRHSKSLNLEKKRCGYCYGEFELIVNKAKNNPSSNNNFPVVYTDPVNELYNLNDMQTKTKLPKKLSKFALFVKENYNQVKRENPSSKHGEIMKLLGSKFATTKMLTPDEIFDNLLDS